jgi:hypothetical protein
MIEQLFTNNTIKLYTKIKLLYYQELISNAIHGYGIYKCANCNPVSTECFRCALLMPSPFVILQSLEFVIERLPVNIQQCCCLFLIIIGFTQGIENPFPFCK